MSFLAACLCLVTEDEETAYWLYAHLIEEVISPGFFCDRPLLLGYHADARIFRELTTQICPRRMPSPTPRPESNENHKGKQGILNPVLDPGRLEQALGSETVKETLSLLSIKWFVSCFLDYLPCEPLLRHQSALGLGLGSGPPP